MSQTLAISEIKLATQDVLAERIPRLDPGLGLLVFITGNYEQHVLFLGDLYPVAAMRALKHARDEDLVPMQRLLRDVLAIENKLDRRAAYAHLLASERTVDDSPALGIEQGLWQTFDRAALQRVYDKIHRVQIQGIEHMLWTGRVPPKKSPSVNAFGNHEVPVYRVLWPLIRPGVELPRERIPRRIESLCLSYGETRYCVSPDHFSLSSTMDQAPNPATRRGAPDYRTVRYVRWHIDASNKVTCDVNPEHHMAPRTQDKYKAGEPLPDFVYCPGCAFRRRQESGGLGKRIRGAQRDYIEPTPYEMEQAARDWEAEQDFYARHRLPEAGD